MNFVRRLTTNTIKQNWPTHWDKVTNERQINVATASPGETKDLSLKDMQLHQLQEHPPPTSSQINALHSNIATAPKEIRAYWEKIKSLPGLLLYQALVQQWKI